MTIEDKKNILSFINITDSWISGYPVVHNYDVTMELNPNVHSFTNSVTTHEVKALQGHKSLSDKKIAQEKGHGGLTIEALNEKIAQCSRCPLCKTRKNTVPGEGVLSPLVLVIGEAPGADEDKSGRAFIGKAGQLLDKMLIAIDLSRESNTYISNIVKCRPPQNRDPLPQEQDACKSFLDLQIQLLKPTMILCLGRVSTQNILGSKETMSALRGKFFEYKGIPLMATYHPSALLRNESLKRPAWEDLKTFKMQLTKIQNNEGV